MRRKGIHLSAWLLIILWGMLGCCGPHRIPDSQAKEKKSLKERSVIIDAMMTELVRAQDQIHLEDFKTPYFIAYNLNDIETVYMYGKYGAIFERNRGPSRRLYVEVRVGDYHFDNTSEVEGEPSRYSDFMAETTAPAEQNPDALKGALWLLTDERYKEAVTTYLAKKASKVYEFQEKETNCFSKQEPVIFSGEHMVMEVDSEKWEDIIRIVTKRFMEHPELFDGAMTFTGTHKTRYLVNSEGTQIVTESILFSVSMHVWTRAEDGMLLDNDRMFYARDINKLPDKEAMLEITDRMIGELLALRVAPLADPYTGPAILAPVATGVLFHEAVGHRLEGERQKDEHEGRTFQGEVGKQILPTFLSLVDDPTKESNSGEHLNGWYKYDSEGVVAEKTLLVDRGVLKSYLISRTPVEGFPVSNGHGRSDGFYKPVARMGNLILKSDPSAQLSDDALKIRLIEETKKQKKPFGLIIKDIEGGSTNTSNYGYQAFKGSPKMVYKVDLETGEETLVRGVEIVGTPLTSINKIIATSDNTGVFNGFCGAESGYVPVSTVAPAVLLTEIELQRTTQEKQRPPLLPAPYLPKKN